MKNNSYLNALYDTVFSRFYFEFEYFHRLDQDLLLENEFPDKCIELKSSDNTSIDDCQTVFKFVTAHEIIGDLEVNLQIDNSTITFNQVKIGDLICLSESDPFLVFNLDSAQKHELCFDKTTFQEKSISVQFDKGFIRVYFLFSLNASLENFPGPNECDPLICRTLQGPNVELLNDWLFCHNHSHNNSTEESNFHIPEEVYKPVILDKIEQVIYLLNDSISPQVLLESVDDKDNSIYLQFEKCNIFASNYSFENQTKQSNVELLNECDDSDFVNGPIDLSISHKCLVQYQIFGKCHFTEDNTQTNHITKSYHQDYYSNDKKLLTKYRMSFEVEWYRVEEKLFRLLANHLIESSEHLTRLKLNFASDFDHFFEHHSNSKLSVALLDWYKFVLHA